MAKPPQSPVDAIAAAMRQANAAREMADQAISAEIVRLCEELRRRREALGLTQAQVATVSGVSRSQVANIESGRGVSVEALIGYAAAVGCRIILGE